MDPSSGSATRRGVYAFLIVITLAVVCARILSVQNLWEPSRNKNEEDRDVFAPSTWPKKRPDPVPTFGSNDRSRWATIYALVEQGTYVIGDRNPDAKTQDNPYGNEGLIFGSDGWRTIDVVLDPETHKFYSSKPPFLSTLLAGEYWFLKHGFGLELKSPAGSDQPDDRWTVVRVMLLSVNAVPMLIYLMLLAKMLEEHGRTDWGRYLVLGAACFGTMLTPFAITLNNHSIATCAALFALYPAVRILQSGSISSEPVIISPELEEPRRWLFVAAGFFAAFTACAELPALSFTVLLLIVLLLRFPRRSLLYFLPPALAPIAFFFVTNYLAVGQLTPIYEKIDTEWYQYDGSIWNVKEREARALQAEREGRPVWEFRNIDWAWHPWGAHEGRGSYAFNLLVGHHGLFSLMPIFLLSLAGMVTAVAAVLRFGVRRFPYAPPLALISSLGLVLLVVVIGFYISRPRLSYGGYTNGPRWLMWLTPFLLLAMLPVADRLVARGWSRWLGYLCLALSVFSMHYWSWNPWRHPWIYNWMDAHGWLKY